MCASAMAEVLFVNPPWASIDQPSLAFGLIKSILRQAGTAAEVRHVNLEFAEAIGVDTYRALKNHNVMIAEWIFSEAAFGPPTGGDSRPPASRFLRFIAQLGEPTRSIAVWADVQRQATAFVAECAARIDWSRYRVAGFTTSMLQTVPSLALARLARQTNPDLKVVFGGANCEAEMGEALIDLFPFIDVVVRGECDGFVADLFDRLLRGKSLDALPICFREGGRVRVAPMPEPFVDMDRNPYPDFDDYFEQLEARTFARSLRPNLLFEGSRGCWYGEKNPCRFCAVNGSKMTYRAKSPERLGAELVHLSRKYDTKRFGASDNIFVHKTRREWADEIARAVPDGRFHFGVKSNLTRADMQALHDAGVRDIEPGIESFSTRVLGLMSKGVTGIQNIHLLRLCLEFSIWPMWNYLFGFPGETMEDYTPILSSKQTLFHLPSPTHGLGLSIMRFSTYFRQPESNGLRLCGPLPHYRYIYPLNEEQLTRIAYYFDYEHLDGYDASMVGRRIEDFARRWREAFSSGARLSATCVGDGVRIDDTRHGDWRRYLLVGPAGILYRAMEHPTRVDAIGRTLRNQTPSAYLGMGGMVGVRRTLSEWAEAGLVYHDHESFVALAAPTQGAAFWDPKNRSPGEVRHIRPPAPSLAQGSAELPK